MTPSVEYPATIACHGLSGDTIGTCCRSELDFDPSVPGLIVAVYVTTDVIADGHPVAVEEAVCDTEESEELAPSVEWISDVETTHWTKCENSETWCVASFSAVPLYVSAWDLAWGTLEESYFHPWDSGDYSSCAVEYLEGND